MDDAHHHEDVSDATRLDEEVNAQRSPSRPGHSDAVCEQCSAIPWEYLCQPMYEWDEPGSIPRIKEIDPGESRIVEISRGRLRAELEYDMDSDEQEKSLAWKNLQAREFADAFKVRSVVAPPGWLQKPSCPVCVFCQAWTGFESQNDSQTFVLQQHASIRNHIPNTGLLRLSFCPDANASELAEKRLDPAAFDSISMLADEEHDHPSPGPEDSGFDPDSRVSAHQDPRSRVMIHSSGLIDPRSKSEDSSSGSDVTDSIIHGWDVLVTSLDAEVARIALHNLIPPEIDYDAISRSIRECRTTHGVTCNQTEHTEIQNLRVIDCKRRKIVAAPLNCDFVALSYVWGQGLEDDVVTIDVEEEAPQTIEDSISVTLQLGYQYLWIDRYCIDQRDKEDTSRQIGQMANIYAAAQITLVAVAGSGPHYGLPGVRRQRRLLGTIRDIKLFPRSSSRDGDSFITLAEWFRRAWTFQECYFSRRKLFFTDHRTIYTCKETALSGDKIVQRLADRDITRNYCLEDFFEFLRRCTLRPMGGHDTISSKSDEAITRMLDILAVYSARELTYQDDALKAVSGALHTFGIHQIYHWWGVPFRSTVFHQEDPGRVSTVELALLWLSPMASKKKGRRKGFPSWSPMGWTNIVRWFLRDRREDGTFSGLLTPHLVMDRYQVEVVNDVLLAAPVLARSAGIRLHMQGDVSSSAPLSMREMRLFAAATATQYLELAVPAVNVRRGPIVCDEATIIIPFSENIDLLMRPAWDLEQYHVSKERSKGLKGLLLSESRRATCGKLTENDMAHFILIVRQCGSHFERIGILALPEAPLLFVKGLTSTGRDVVMPRHYGEYCGIPPNFGHGDVIFQCPLHQLDEQENELLDTCHITVTDKYWWRQYFTIQKIVLG